MQLTEQPREIGDTGRGAFLGQVAPERDRVAVGNDGLVD